MFNSRLILSPVSGSFMGLLQNEIAGDIDVQEYDIHCQTKRNLFLQGPTSDDGIAATILLQSQYERNADELKHYESRSQTGNKYLDQLWIGKKLDRNSLVSVLSTSPWANAGSDFSCLRNETQFLTDEVINTFLSAVCALRPNIGCFSTFFYTKLCQALQLPGEATRQSELTQLCRWVHPKGTRNLKREYSVPICIGREHYIFVHVDLKINSTDDLDMVLDIKSTNGKRKSDLPELTYYDPLRGELKSCFENLEVFFKHLAVERNYPELQCSWKKKNGGGPTQHDGWNCGLFVCAGIDCLSSGISPTGYGSQSSMAAFRSELQHLFTEAGLGILA